MKWPHSFAVAQGTSRNLSICSTASLSSKSTLPRCIGGLTSDRTTSGVAESGRNANSSWDGIRRKKTSRRTALSSTPPHRSSTLSTRSFVDARQVRSQAWLRPYYSGTRALAPLSSLSHQDVPAPQCPFRQGGPRRLRPRTRHAASATSGRRPARRGATALCHTTRTRPRRLWVSSSSGRRRRAAVLRPIRLPASCPRLRGSCSGWLASCRTRP